MRVLPGAECEPDSPLPLGGAGGEGWTAERVGVGLVMLSEAEASLGDRPAKKPRRFSPLLLGEGPGGEGWRRGVWGMGLVMLSEAEASLGDRPAKKPRRFSPLPVGEGPGVRVGGGRVGWALSC